MRYAIVHEERVNGRWETLGFVVNVAKDGSPKTIATYPTFNISCGRHTLDISELQAAVVAGNHSPAAKGVKRPACKGPSYGANRFRLVDEDGANKLFQESLG